MVDIIIVVGIDSGYFVLSDDIPKMHGYCEYIAFTCCDAIEHALINQRMGNYGAVSTLITDPGHLRGDLEWVIPDMYDAAAVRRDLYFLYELLYDYCFIEHDGCPKLRSVEMTAAQIKFKFEWNSAYGLPNIAARARGCHTLS